MGIAVDALRADKVRAALTTLGVGAGVFVVVAVSAALDGINASVTRELESAGPASFSVYKEPVASTRPCRANADVCPARQNPPISLDDARAIGELASVRTVTAHVASTATYTYAGRVVRGGGLDGYTVSWLDIAGGAIHPGRSFTHAEYRTAARVAVVSATLSRLLFGGSHPIDEVIGINGVPFRVIGVYQYKPGFLGRPGSSTRGDAPRAILPLEAAREYLGVSLRPLDLMVTPRATVSQAEALEDVTALLRERRGLRPGSADDFAVVTSERLVAVYNRFLDPLFLAMVGAAAFSLLAGGVGVVAIMMISVVERRREIGVRKALGATRRVILCQFLVEAATLASVGAVAGLVAGSVAAVLVDWLTAIPMSIPLGSAATALLLAVLTGITFGAMPAARAAGLEASEALRRG